MFQLFFNLVEESLKSIKLFLDTSDQITNLANDGVAALQEHDDIVESPYQKYGQQTNTDCEYPIKEIFACLKHNIYR